MTNKPGNWRQGIAAFCRWGLVWLSIGLFTLLAGINLLRTAFMDINRESSYQELVSYEADHPLRFLLFLAAAKVVEHGGRAEKQGGARSDFFAWGILGVWWIWNIGVEPSADPANILWAAGRFAGNDFTYLRHGQYLFRYPHQLPVTAFLELFLRLVGPDNPYRVQLLRLFNLAAALWAMYVLTRLYRQELAENDTFKKNDAVIVLFGAGVLFSTFIYGNIPSMALAFTALWLQLQWQREEGHPAWKLLLNAVCTDTPLNARIVEWMNQYQSLIWVCGAWYLWHKRKTLQMEQLLPALAIFGGFLFQLVWEGKSQYILQYFMLALPYGAAGLNEMAAALKTRILRLRSRQSKTAKAG